MVFQLEFIIFEPALVQKCGQFLTSLTLLQCVCGHADTTAPKHWAFQPISTPAVPDGEGTNVVDRFVIAGLSKNRVAVESPTNRRALVRRLSFDLRGLPPSPEEVKTSSQMVRETTTSEWWNVSLLPRNMASVGGGNGWKISKP